MDESFWRTLETHRPDLRGRWEALLRSEPASSGMAHPDSLIYLMDWTLDEWLAELRQSHFQRHQYLSAKTGSTVMPRSHCPCRKNPLLAYFATAEQAIVEVMFVECTEIVRLSEGERRSGLENLKNALRIVADREIQTFCAVCKDRTHAETKIPAQHIAAQTHAA